MSSDTLLSQRETLEDRLAKRRRLRGKRFLDKEYVDGYELTSINQSPKITRSLDRKSSARLTQIHASTSYVSAATSADQRKSSTPILPQIAKTQSVEPNNEKQQQIHSHQDEKPETVSPVVVHENSHSHQDVEPVIIKETTAPGTLHENSHSHQDVEPVINKETTAPVVPVRKSTPPQQETHEYHHLHDDEKPLIIKETVPPVVPPRNTEKSTPIQHKTHENSHSHHDEKPVMIKETILPISLPPMVPLTKTDKSNPRQPKIRENSIPNRIKHHSPISPDYASSLPETGTDLQSKHFHFPPFPPTPIARSTSQPIVPRNKQKHRSNYSMFPRHDSLALAYLFNKRMISGGFSPASSSNSEQSNRKTIWD
jgi:hypothetical protein